MTQQIKTPQQRLAIYQKLLKIFLDREHYPKDRYPYGLCIYLMNEIPAGYSCVLYAFPELKRVRPIFSSKDSFWWKTDTEKGYKKRIKAIEKMIKLVKKQINDSQTASPMVDGNPSQSN